MDKRFSVLSFFSICLKVIGWIILVIGLLQLFDELKNQNHLFYIFEIIEKFKSFATIIIGIVIVAFGEIIDVLLSIEYNTRKFVINHMNFSTNSQEADTTKIKVETLKNQKKNNQCYISENLPLILNNENKLDQSLEQIFNTELHYLINEINKMIDSKQDVEILNKYSKLTLIDFISEGKLAKDFNDSELFIYRNLLEGFIFTLEEKGIDLTTSNKSLCNKCGSSLVVKKTKNDKKVLVCSKYPDCKEINYINS